MKTLSLIVLFFVSAVARGYAADPFSERVTAEKTAAEKAAQAKVDEATAIKEKNSVAVPDDLLPKMEFREWYLRPSKHSDVDPVTGKATTKMVFVLCRKGDHDYSGPQAHLEHGKLTKIYFVQREDKVLVLKSIVITAKDGSTKELLLERNSGAGLVNGGLGTPHAGDDYRGFLVHSGGELFPYKPGFVKDPSGLFDNRNNTWWLVIEGRL